MERPHGPLTSSDTPYDAATPDPDRVASTSGEVEQLKSEIHETQAELQQTVAAIQERLSPAHLKEQAASTVHDATIGRVHQMMNRAEDRVSQAAESTREAATTVTSEFRNNPMPYALIGIGVAWLFASHRKNRSWDGGEMTSEWSASRARSTSDLNEEVGWGVPSTGYASGSSSYSQSRGAYESGQSAGSYAQSQSAGSRVQRLRSGWQGMLQDNPMALGAAALAAGALIGATIPATQVENEYLGEARDSVVESAKTLAEQTAEKVVEKT